MLFNPKAIVFHSHPTSLWHYLKIKFFRAYWRTKVYKRHKGKMAKDSYTSQAVKLQAALFYLLVLAAAGALFAVFSFAAMLAILVLLFATTLPFAAWAFSRDKTVAIISPFVSMLRTAMFGIGLALGTLRELLGK